MEISRIINTALLLIILLVLLLTKCEPSIERHTYTVWRDSIIVIMDSPVIVNPPIPQPVINNYGGELDLKLLDSLIKYRIAFCDTFQREYPIYYEDSLIQLDINSTVKGILIASPFKYYIKPTTIQYPTITITERLSPRGLYVGASSQFYNYNRLNSQVDLQLEASFLYKKGLYGIGYSPFTNSIGIRVSYRIL